VPAAEARTDVADVLNVTYLSRTLKVHSSDMVGEFSAEAHAETGAAAQGFVLADHVQPKGQINQPSTPQNQTRPYWKSLLAVTPVTGTEKQPYWALSYGSRTDAEFLKKIH
jgi:hypothetical protein